jgi:hypothetical protein
MANFQGVDETTDIDVVCAVDEHDVNTTHTGNQWDHAPGHDFVFAEEAFISNVPASESKSYEDDGEDGAPPAVEQGWIVPNAGAALRRSFIVDAARQYHRW